MESHKFMFQTNQLLLYLPFFPLDLKNFRPGPASRLSLPTTNSVKGLFAQLCCDLTEQYGLSQPCLITWLKKKNTIQQVIKQWWTLGSPTGNPTGIHPIFDSPWISKLDSSHLNKTIKHLHQIHHVWFDLHFSSWDDPKNPPVPPWSLASLPDRLPSSPLRARSTPRTADLGGLEDRKQHRSMRRIPWWIYSKSINL